jgi:hypothetical protein
MFLIVIFCLIKPISNVYCAIQPPNVHRASMGPFALTVSLGIFSMHLLCVSSSSNSAKPLCFLCSQIPNCASCRSSQPTCLTCNSGFYHNYATRTFLSINSQSIVRFVYNLKLPFVWSRNCVYIMWYKLHYWFCKSEQKLSRMPLRRVLFKQRML